MSDLPDLHNRDDIRVVVDAFYDRVRRDELIGFIFDRVAQVDWETHLPKMYDFWDTVAFRAGTFKGNPLRAHLDLSTRTEMGEAQFERWKSLFHETVDAHFAGENADFLKNAANDIAQVMLSRITGRPIPFASSRG